MPDNVFSQKDLESASLEPILSGANLPWVHGPKVSEWRRDRGLRPTGIFYSHWYDITYMCLGTRMVHLDYLPGTSMRLAWRGSYVDNWHGGPVNMTAPEAVQWLQRASYKDLGPLLWAKDALEFISKNLPEDSLG